MRLRIRATTRCVTGNSYKFYKWTDTQATFLPDRENGWVEMYKYKKF